MPRIIDIAKEISSGLTPLRSNLEYWTNGTIPWLKTEQIGEYRIKTTNEFITQKALDKTGLKLYPQNTISIAMYGEGKTRGNVSILDCPMTTNQACCNIIPNEDIVEPFYLYYFFKTQYNNLRQLSSGVRKNLNSNDIKNYKINLPNKKIQKNIANFLCNIDEKIELNNKINFELENLAKTLYEYWFVQFDFPDEFGRPYKSSGGAMVYNDVLKKEIPIDWEVKNLFEAMDVQYGYPFNTDMFYEESDKGLIPVVRIRDILENTVSAYSSEKVDNKYKLNEKDLVIGMDGNFHMNFWKDNYSYLNQRSVRIRKKESYNISAFQAYYELMPYIKAREKNISRTTVGHLSDKDLKRLNIIIPKTNDNFNPTSVFENLLKKVIVNRKEIANLVTLRDFLLPMLMNRQISITDE